MWYIKAFIICAAFSFWFMGQSASPQPHHYDTQAFAQMADSQSYIFEDADHVAIPKKHIDSWSDYHGR